MPLNYDLEKEIGIVIGSTSTTRFSFVIRDDIKRKPKLGDIVKTEGENETIYGIITDIQIKSPDPLELGKDYRTISFFADKLSFTNQVEIAEVKILGAKSRSNPKLHRPIFPPRPNSKVYYPSEDEIRELYSSKYEDYIDVGKIRDLNVRPGLKIVEIVIKHLAIFGVTGAGKSHTVAVLSHKLSSVGIPVLIFDVHRDYIFTFKNSIIITFDEHEYKQLKNKLGEDKVVLVKIQLSDIKYELFEILGVSFSKSPIMYSILKEIFENKNQKIETIEELENELKTLINSSKVDKKIKDSVISLLRRLERIKGSKIFLSEKSRETAYYNLIDLLKLNEKEIGSIETTEEREAILNKLKDVVDLDKLRVEHLNKINYENGIIIPGKIIIIDLFPLSYTEQQIVIYVVLHSIFVEWKKMKNTLNKIVPLVTIIEEAHRFASKESYAEELMSVIAREGRKFGIGLWIVSQIPNKISEGIISQINTFILHRLINPKDLSFIRSACPYLSEEYFNALTQLERGEAILVGLGVEQPVIIQIDNTIDGNPIKIGGSEEEIRKAIKELKDRFSKH